MIRLLQHRKDQVIIERMFSSLHRGIDSAWPADYVMDPRHGVLAFPLAVFLVGVLPLSE